MAATKPLILNLSVNTRFAKPVLMVMCPLVWIGVLSVERAVAFAMRFARFEAKLKGSCCD